MPRGNGKQAQNAKSSGRLSAFVKPQIEAGEHQGQPDFVDWGEVNGNYLHGAIIAAVRAGGALLLGCSTDKTQYSVRVYDGGQGTSYYFRCSPTGLVELEDFLQALMAIYDE